MAALTRREIELALGVTTTGAEAIGNLSADVRELAAQGGAAAPELQRLNKELDSVGEQAKALATLESLSGDMARLASAERDASAGAATLKGNLLTLAQATNTAQQAERESQAALRAGQRAVQDKADAVKLLKASTDLAGRGTTEYAANLERLTREALEARAGVRELSAAHEQSRGVLRDAKEAQAALGKEYKVASNEARSTAIALRAVSTQVEAANTTLRKAGIETNDLAAAQLRVQAAYRATEAAIRTTAATAATSTRVQTTALADLGQQLRTVQSIAATAIGGNIALDLAKDAATAADSYKQLEARIKLVTGEGDALQAAFAGVREIALRTNTSLENTGVLFSRIAQAGKEIGVSQADALALTETINQAVQLSGTSSESSNAAITQLIQGLQSGVLRGEEFNSVMEQAPRLALALASGLGTTTGELRKLANQGALTSDVVIKALQGQSAVLQAEFGSLPATVGKSLQNLSTAWTVYIGEANKASGTTKTVAEAIDLLSKNLNTVIGFLLDAGQAAAAFTALRLAQSFLGIGQAAQVSAAGIAASTTAMQANALASGGAAASVGRFASILGSIKAFSLVAVLVNIQDIGKALGEGIAKLQGYKDNSDELAAANAALAERTRLAAQAQAQVNAELALASEKARGLTPEAKALTVAFEELRTKGDSVSEALEKIGKKANLSDISGIQAFGIALNDLSATGKASGDAIRNALANALKGEDLAVFETTARAAFKGSANEATIMATIVEAKLREALRRAGGDVSELRTGIGATARRGISDFTALADSIVTLGIKGAATDRALRDGLSKALETARTEGAVKALIERIEELGRGGVVSGTALSDAMEKARAKLDQVKEGVNSAAEAFAVFGLKSQGELTRLAATTGDAYKVLKESGQATASQLAEAFVRSANDAIAANKGIAPSWVQTEAAVRGATVAVDEHGKATVSLGDKSKQTTDKMAQGFADVRGQVQLTTAELEAQAKALDDINAKYGQSQKDRDFKYGKVGSGGASRLGNTREEKLAGQNAVDNSLRYRVEEKFRAGRLAQGDAGDLDNVIAALRQNDQIFSENANVYSLEGAFSAQRDRALIAQLEDARGNLRRQEGGDTIVRTVNLNLRAPDGSVSTVQTNEAGAQGIVDVLKKAKLAA
jgi:tape measure domain-containing protein